MRAIALVLALAACSGRAPTPPLAVPTDQAVPASVRATGTEPSIYELGLVLHDAHGERIGLDVHRGKPVLLTMFYASCSIACPALIEDVRRTLAAMPPDVHVVLVSFDPARDTPARLAELAAARGLDARWTLAAPDEADARELAAAIGYRYRKLDNGEFFHGSTILLLDADGRPLARTEGFGQGDALVAALHTGP